MRRTVLAIGLPAVVLIASCEDYPTPPEPPKRILPSTLLLWRDSTTHHNARPAVGDTAVYVLSRTSDATDPFNSTSHQVTAYAKQNGMVLWRAVLPVTNSARIGYGLLVIGNILVVGDGDLFGINTGNGSLLWRYVPSVGRFPGYFLQATDGQTVYAGGSHVFAVDVVSGSEKWVTAIDTGDNVRVFSPVVRDSVVYVAASSSSFTIMADIGSVAALSKTTGEPYWITRLEPAAAGLNTTTEGVAVTDDKVVAAVHGGPVFGLDRVTGLIVDTLPAATFVSPGINPQASLFYVYGAGAHVFVGSTLSTVTALNAADLSVAWQANRTSVLNFTADETYLYVGYTGVFDVRRKTDGGLVWQVMKGDLRADGQEAIIWSPAFDADNIYVGAANEVYAFRKN